MYSEVNMALGIWQHVVCAVTLVLLPAVRPAEKKWLNLDFLPFWGPRSCFRFRPTTFFLGTLTNRPILVSWFLFSWTLAQKLGSHLWLTGAWLTAVRSSLCTRYTLQYCVQYYETVPRGSCTVPYPESS